jgi:pimeloyl-ACP methyl ester carboxylesterase
MRFDERTIAEGTLALGVSEGPTGGSPLVLLHGVTRRWRDYLPVMPGLSARYHVHALDFRGHGGSSRVQPGAYRVVDYGYDVLALLDRLPGPAIVAGHSLGAMVAAWVAAERPERVRAVVLEDPPFAMMGERIGETFYHDLFRGYRALAGSDRPVREVAEALGEVRVRPPGSSGAVPLRSIRDAASLRFAAACLRRLDPAVLAPIVAGAWLEGLDVAGTLRGVGCPALFLQGDYDAGGALPDDYAGELASHLPDVAHVRLAGVGHAIHGIRPADYLRLVSEFLESLD